MQRLHGIFTPNLVPLTQQGDIDDAKLASYVNWLIDRGVHGLYPNGSVGEFVRFSVEERRRIAKIVCEVCKARGVPVMVGATEAHTRDILRSCELYAGYGARAISLLPPIYFKLSNESLYAYFAEVARNSPIDITLYNIPLFASPIDVPTLVRVASEFPRIVGIKDSSGDVAHLARMINAVKPRRPDFVFFSGWEAALVPQLLLGADGGVHATSNVLPELTRMMYDHFRAGRLDQAVKLQLRLMEFFDLMVFGGADFPDGVRIGAEIRGHDMGRSRQPQTEKQLVDRQKLATMMQCIMSEFGVVDAPAGGCALREPKGTIDVAREVEVQRVTEAVVATLRSKGLVS
ncbi:MAG: dihydrodipicolinate synthase family protein [Tepidisphaeraceae bacterium]